MAPFAEALRERVPSREALLAEAKAQTARQRRRGKQSAAGGLLMLLLAGGIWILDPAWHTEDIHTAIGQRSTTRLADGSDVILNTGSHLRIESRLRSRRLELVQGEATFTVVHEPKPLIVRSQGVHVRDIGTVFNVRSDSRGVVVSVVEGAVEVSNGQTPARLLEAGQQVQASRERISTTRRIDPDAVTAWQQGKLRFDGTPLREVIADIQRYRQAPIRLDEARLGSLRVSGEYDTNAIESLIDLLPAILPVSLARGSDGTVVVHGVR
ncbi:FecR family protein [Azomonas macrocytogenes]|uniref:FecR family protein n=1 Tax=Azomonas macrocytogenes TaxID=69962 RepID=UPI001605F6BF|nr:FecR domain-containing protein [Azomonas macrocytogenes]